MGLFSLFDYGRRFNHVSAACYAVTAFAIGVSAGRRDFFIHHEASHGVVNVLFTATSGIG